MLFSGVVNGAAGSSGDPSFLGQGLHTDWQLVKTVGSKKTLPPYEEVKKVDSIFSFNNGEIKKEYDPNSKVYSIENQDGKFKMSMNTVSLFRCPSTGEMLLMKLEEINETPERQKEIIREFFNNLIDLKKQEDLSGFITSFITSLGNSNPGLRAFLEKLNNPTLEIRKRIIQEFCDNLLDKHTEDVAKDVAQDMINLLEKKKGGIENIRLIPEDLASLKKLNEKLNNPTLGILNPQDLSEIRKRIIQEFCDNLRDEQTQEHLLDMNALTGEKEILDSNPDLEASLGRLRDLTSKKAVFVKLAKHTDTDINPESDEVSENNLNMYLELLRIGMYHNLKEEEFKSQLNDLLKGKNYYLFKQFRLMMKIASQKQMIINKENFKKFFNKYSTKSEMYTDETLYFDMIDLSFSL